MARETQPKHRPARLAYEADGQALQRGSFACDEAVADCVGRQQGAAAMLVVIQPLQVRHPPAQQSI